MALLSDLVGATTTGSPDGGAVKLTSVFAGRGAYDYTPATPLTAGKYAMKCSSNSRGILRFSGSGNQEVIFKNLSGTDVRGSENQAVIDLPNTTNTLSMAFESFDRDPAPLQRPLPAFYPGNSTRSTNYTGTVTLNTSNSLSLYGSSSMLASTPDGKTQVAVGGNGTSIFASRDYGNTWHEVGNYNNLGQGTFGGQTNSSYSVEYFNGRFIIGGGPDTSYGMLSNNGFDWEYSGDGNLTTVRTAFVSPSGYIFGRHSGSSNVGFSPDGQSFSLYSPSGLSGNVTCVFWDGTNYLAFDDGSRMATSTDGSNWNAAYSIPFICRGIQKLSTTWYAISQTGQLYYSTNLTTWTSGSTLSSSTYYNHQLRKNGSTLVYYDPVNGQIKTSSDGVAWIVRVSGLNQNGTLSVDALGKMWYRQSDTTSYYCPAGNPIAWNLVIHPNQNTQANSIAYGSGTGGARWVVGQNSGYLMSAPDGFTWTERTSSFTGGNNFVNQNINTVKFLNSRFIAVGGAGTLAYSLDGDTWTRSFYNGSNGVVNATNIRAVSYGGTSNLYVIGQDNGYFYTSPDLTTWTRRNSAMDDQAAIREIHFANNLFVAVGDGGWIMTSTDAITWTKRSPLFGIATASGGTFNGQYTGDNLYGVSYGTTTAYPSGLWVICGTSGTTWYSTTGTDFRQGIKTSALYQAGNMWRVRYAVNRFWITGNNGYLAWTIDGEDIWQVSSGHLVQDVYDVATDGTLLMSCANNGQLTFNHTQPGAASNDYNTWAHSQNMGALTVSTQYTGAMANGLYIYMNANGIWRTYDQMEFLPYVYNRYSQNNALTDVVGGNGMFVAMANGTNRCYYSPDGNRWNSIRKYSRNVENRCNTYSLNFEEGYFWKYYNYSIQRSADGKTWHTYYTFPYGTQLPNNIMPSRFKRTGGTWFAWDGSTSVNTNYLYNHDLLRNPRNWRVGSLGVNTQGIWDIAMVDDLVVFSCTDAVRVSQTPSGSNAYNVRVDAANSAFGQSYKAWEIGGNIFIANTSGNVYQILKDQGGSIQTTASTVWLATAMNVQQTVSSDNTYQIKKSGNVCFGFSGNDPVIWDASIPVTFSIFTSTMATAN